MQLTHTVRASIEPQQQLRHSSTSIHLNSSVPKGTHVNVASLQNSQPSSTDRQAPVRHWHHPYVPSPLLSSLYRKEAPMRGKYSHSDLTIPFPLNLLPLASPLHHFHKQTKPNQTISPNPNPSETSITCPPFLHPTRKGGRSRDGTERKVQKPGT